MNSADGLAYQLDFNVSDFPRNTSSASSINGGNALRYSVHADSVGNLEFFLATLVEGEWIPYTANEPLTFVAYMRADLPAAVNNLATALTNQLRSGQPGDNLNATVVEGQAVVSQPFVHVRWAWLTLFVLEVLLAVGMLVGSILARTVQGHRLKTSAVGLLFHGLSGWDREELRESLAPVRGEHSLESMDMVAQHMRARFAPDADGVLKFVKVE